MMSDNTRILIIGAVLLIIFICLKPKIEEQFANDDKEFDEGMVEIPKFLHNVQCKPECCNHSQWLPEYLEKELGLDNNFLPSNLTCYNGCLCIEKEDLETLASRGNNR